MNVRHGRTLVDNCAYRVMSPRAIRRGGEGEVLMSQFDLQRFRKAQERSYGFALDEIRAGEKQSHWIWFVFPQLKGLGFSETSEYYGIDGLDEARAYLADPVLGARLKEISVALLAHKGKSALEILGYPDDLKVCSSMTLFDAVESNAVFADVLAAFYDGKRDERTLEMLKGK